MGRFKIWSGSKPVKKDDNMAQSAVKKEPSNPINDLKPWESLGHGDQNEVVELLSRPEGVVDVGEDNRLFVAVIKDKVKCQQKEDVVLLVANEPRAFPVMQLAKQLARQAGFTTVASFKTSHATLGSLYEVYANYSFDDVERLAEDDMWIQERMTGIVADAVINGASDIHFTLRSQLACRFRIDGSLSSHGGNMAHREGELFVRALYKLYIAPNSKTDFNPNIRESASLTIPVDVNGAHRRVRLRYEQAPGAPLGDGNMSIDIVMRINSDGSAVRIPDFETLGFDRETCGVLRNIAQKYQGVFLVVGGTGSGKSTTLDSLYQAAVTYSNATKKIISIADPPEAHVPGVNIQPLFPDGASRVDDEKGGSNKATLKALKSALRQDPDIIGIGEIRDPDIASLAFEAALTGHLVASTLHAARAFDAYIRIIEYYKFNAAMMCSPGMVQAILAQKLLPKVCMNCALTFEDLFEEKYKHLYHNMAGIVRYIEKNVGVVDYDMNEHEIARRERLGIPDKLARRDYSGFRFANVARDNNCNKCAGRGIDGRALVYEMFVPSSHPEVEELLAQDFRKNYHQAIKKWQSSKAKKYEDNMIDGITLNERALMYAKQGITCTAQTQYILGDLR